MTDTTHSAADEEIMRLATQDDDAGEQPAEQKPDDTLELGGEEAPVATEEDKAEEEAKDEKKRSRPWSQRVDILTARLREAEREAAELRARAGGDKADDDPAPDPNSDKYEFGEADPQFIRDFAAHAARQAIKEERAKAAEADAATAGQREVAAKLHEGMANIEKTGAEKYEDFEAKIAEAVDARGGEPLPPLVSVGIAVSPAGADIAYRLATDEAASERIEKLAQTNPQQAAIEFGKLEGEYLDDDSDADLNPADPLDMARMLGRMKARLSGKRAPNPVERKTTKAPAPPETRARGGNGQFEVSDDTEDFAAYERKVMGGKG
jgi:hypothetical protein